MAANDFWKLREAPLHEFQEADWEAYYPAMARWLAHDDADIREACVERLAMAVLSAEVRTLPRDDGGTESARHRLSWLLEVLVRAHAKHTDVLGFFLDNLRYHGDKEPFLTPLLDWLRALHRERPFGISPEHVEGILVLITPCDDWDTQAPHWIALLDHPSDYVRACAAYRLANCGTDTTPDTDTLFALIQRKEIERPGIAGPFWTNAQYRADEISIDPAEWMLGILEQRQTDEPAGLPFCGIDFHLHEWCSNSPQLVERMRRGGHLALALETATETRGVVQGMLPQLLALGDEDDPRIAHAAWWHLALYYHTLHPRAHADEPGIRHFPLWQPDADMFVLHEVWDDKWRNVMVLYPAREGEEFDDVRAWALIDMVLPPEIRGALAHHFLSAHDAPPAPFRLGDDLLFEFETGALLKMEGDPDQRRWRRLEIVGRGIQEQ
ncbi:hypothetical protein CSC70_08835 [Pseudoxanthomonas kalamensis DSM 18571]|uniref:hypothetical protein n=1 Tax=Pseudoxanthomonas kalamensis TaxID=289483 RepID=UPI001391B311|nr:hypothetical protein [Pseudoxanthomonas kalamensis]KAF1709793.1 hypothetical protein CSC70_08835 [Pseudoxanthomonas kalamensis DSM 18571]